MKNHAQTQQYLTPEEGRTLAMCLSLMADLRWYVRIGYTPSLAFRTAR